MDEQELQDIIRKITEADRFCDGKLRCEIIRLDTMEMISKYSFVAHKSINHLDLSLKEFSSLREKPKVFVPLLFCSADPAYSKKFVNTAEGCRKTLKLERRWLYTLHLDLPIGRENDSLSLVPYTGQCWKPKTFCFNEFTVDDSVYKKSLRRFIEQALQKNGMEMNFIRSHMALMKRVLGVRLFEANSLEDKILNFLFSTCKDSNIVLEFLPLLHLNSWLLTNPKLSVLEYVLKHAYRGRYDLKLNDSQGVVLNECFFNSHFKYVELLLKYQNAPYYYEYDCGILVSSWMRDAPNQWYPEDLEIPFQRGLLSRRRYSLWLQIFHAYCVRNQPPLHGKVSPTLRLLWRSLPDAFFTLEELQKAYAGVRGSRRVIGAVHRFYVRSIAGDLKSGTPRPLKHFCRTTIRKSLCYNLRLPHGIEELRVPPKLKAFLSLEK